MASPTDQPDRHAHVYVFEWHPGAEPKTDQRDPLELVVLRRTGDLEFPPRWTIGLDVIRSMAEPVRAWSLDAWDGRKTL